jgi:hypothetical protein
MCYNSIIINLPVETPQPNKHIFVKSAPGWILAAEISAITAYSAKVEQPIKWKIGLPSLDILLVPSGMKPLPWVARILGHKLVLSLWQKIQSCSLHSGV